MTNQNRSSESGRFRSDDDDDDQRSRRRRDQDDDWRREDPNERNFGRNEAYGRENRRYGGTGESEPWEQGGYRVGSRSAGISEREAYRNLRGDRQDYAQDYDRQGGASGGDFRSQRYGGQDYGGQRYGGQDYAGQRYGGQRLAGQDYGGQRLAGQDYGGQRYGGQDYAGQRYGGQDPERQYGSSGYGTPQYGAFGGTESGRQGRVWQQLGGASQSTEGWPRGEHRGKGPKGYKRSDDRIREDVCDRLSDDDELDASEITVAVKDGEVTLEGSVSDRRAKQRAEDLAESVGGVRDVDNKLRKNKGMLQEMGERLTGSQNNERGHAGSGTKNTPPNASMSR
jgi:hypothetical protein